MRFRDLKRQYEALKQRLDEEIQSVIEEGEFIAGAKVGELESKLAEYVGAKHCITCASGTDAIRLSLMAFKIGCGDAVFVPDFTFFATAEMPAALGAVPVFVDVLPDTYNIDPQKIEESILKVKKEGRLRPRAVIPVDLFGQCADYGAIGEIAEKYGLTVIEDAAQSFGGKIGEKRACSFGNIAAASFFPSKPLGCYGDGGAVFTDDEKIAALIRSYAVHGMGANKYDNERIGLNSRLDTLQAAVLLAKFDAFKEYELEKVNEAAAWYTEMLSGTVKTPSIKREHYSSWAQYTIRTENKEQREALRKALKEKGIPSMVYYPKGLHRQRAFEGLPLYGAFPVTDHLCETVLSLPIHPYMERNDVEEVAETIKECLKMPN
ncbi:MAG: DegT/DnrJ/EryC1/StrS family aminotransferase [Clostridiales bacterium]|nr:DegT/DnrJ/EryC1/StrS family aminotransferase [Clostridiales bacterium]